MTAQISKLSQTDSVPIELWDRDHWSCLAYIETKMVDSTKGLVVEFDPRMRQNRRNFRVLHEASKRHLQHGVPMAPEYGSRLRDNTFIPGHDDWDCVADFCAAGLLHMGDEEIKPGLKLKLTERGHEVVGELRKHKCNGGIFGNFVLKQEASK